MAMIQSIATKEEAARLLAREHFRYEPDLLRIFRVGVSRDIEQRPDEPIKLLEVNPETVEAGIMPLGFDPTPERGMPYPYILMEVTPGEFARIEQGQLRLPQSWMLLEELGRE